jgi:hypothetical protein
MLVREGQSPSLKSLPPLLLRERGIKGVRLINNIVILSLSSIYLCDRMASLWR